MPIVTRKKSNGGHRPCPNPEEHAMNTEVVSKQEATVDEVVAARRYRMEIEWSDEDDKFLVRFPDAPGVVTNGATREEAAAMGDDAIISWYTALKDAGREIPQPNFCSGDLEVAIPDGIDGDEIRAIRIRLEVSQRVFSKLLNVSPTTVRSWEQGWRVPDGASRRLIAIARDFPEVIMSQASIPGDRN